MPCGDARCGDELKATVSCSLREHRVRLVDEGHSVTWGERRDRADPVGFRSYQGRVAGRRQGCPRADLSHVPNGNLRRPDRSRRSRFIEIHRWDGGGGRRMERGREGVGGALGRIRTSDPRNRNPMLYPAELRARGPGGACRPAMAFEYPTFAGAYKGEGAPMISPECAH